MNKKWSEELKKIRVLLKNEKNFFEGKKKLLEFRYELFCEWEKFFDIQRDFLFEMPYPNSKGYDSKNIAYSIYHVFRIEDIVSNTLISDNEEIILLSNYEFPIMTTGNELVGMEIKNALITMNIEKLHEYIKKVYDNTNDIIEKLEYNDLKKKIPSENREKLINEKSVNEKNLWLVDYWCDKDVLGLINMPLTRHWIMHLEASKRIENGLKKVKKR